MTIIQDAIHIITAFFDIYFAFEVYRSFFILHNKRKKYLLLLLPLGFIIVMLNNAHISQPYIRIFGFSLFIFFSSIFVFHGTILTKLFVCLLYNAIYQVGDMFVWGLVLLFFPDYYSMADSMRTSVSIFVFGSVAYYIYLLIFTLVFRLQPLKDSGNTKASQCLLLSTVSFFGSVTIVILLTYFMRLQVKDFYIYLLPSSFFIGLVLFIIIYFKMIQKSQENSKAIAVYNNEMKSFAQQYSVLARTNKEMSKLRHDWKQHLRMICGLVQGNNFDKLKIYVNGLSEIVENERTSYVGDPVIDIILSGFVQTAKQSGIEVDIVTDLKYTLEINPIDLCILISNSTDNAIEACRRMTTDSNREIWIGVKTDDKHLFYTIKNTFLGEIQRNGERILSVKEAPEEHGIGLQSIEKVVEKHNGYVTITANNGIFELLSVLDNTNITDYTM